MKNKKILYFLTNHFSLIQTVICIVYLLGWVIIANNFMPDLVKESNKIFDLSVVFLELVYILIMLEGIFYQKGEDKKLHQRSQTTLSEFLREAKHDVYITGIINNSVINFFLNNRILLEDCIHRNIKIHILFYVSDNEDKFDWYLKNMYGNNEYKEKIDSDKSTYRTQLQSIESYDVFKMLKEKGLLEIKRIDLPITTAYVARDINKTFNQNGKIQCLFYQYKVDSPDCPAYIIDSDEEIYPQMCKVILDMWNDAVCELDVSYI